MTKLCIFVGTLVGGWVFWYAGDWLGFEFTGCFVLSCVGSIAGIFAGWKFAERFE